MERNNRMCVRATQSPAMGLFLKNGNCGHTVHQGRKDRARPTGQEQVKTVAFHLTPQRPSVLAEDLKH